MYTCFPKKPLSRDLPVFNFTSLVNKNSPMADVYWWLGDEHYQHILSNFTASILLDASCACISHIFMPNTQRKKESYIFNILTDFLAQRSLLVSISDKDFKYRANQSAETAGKNIYHVFAYRMQNMYSDIIGSAFRELPHETKVPPDFTTLKKYLKERSWMSKPWPSQTLIEQIEKSFQIATLMSSVKKIFAHRRPLLTSHPYSIPKENSQQSGVTVPHTMLSFILE